ncbi:adhesion G-protein coupled receptor F3 isoform 2-T3 [Spinachia spinachia]
MKKRRGVSYEMNIKKRMWTVCVLYILGLNICQTAGQDNSTQMYYVKLVVEESAIPNITAALTPFVKNPSVNVYDLKITTRCEVDKDVTRRCSCEPPFRWSDRLCQKCCGKPSCTVTGKTAGICVSNESESIWGSITLIKREYYNCLKEKESEEFMRCNTFLLEAMKAVYSTMVGFDTLRIRKYRVGSVIADFEMIFAYSIKQQNLIEKSDFMSSSLSASINLETSGVVRLIMPSQNPVCNYDKPNLTCTVREDLRSTPVWQLKRAGTVLEIFNGTQADVTDITMGTKVSLKRISALWAGEYTCIYRQEGNFTKINHTASAVMNVSLLPNIDITLTPPFPRCSKDLEFVTIKVKCEIESNNESYNVVWKGKHLSSLFPFLTDDAYMADVVASCNNSYDKPIVMCTFRNKCKEERTALTAVHLIYANDHFCPADGHWKDTKAGFEAVLKCQTGERKRKCSADGTWEKESSTCVKQQVHDVLQEAEIIDIGLGSLDDNSAKVFSLLQNVTSDSATINTSPDINTTVSVFSILTQKIQSIDDKLTVDNFLESSSNILDSSLKESWTKQPDVGNLSLAERYLDSLEQLIHKTNLCHARKQENLDAAISNCRQSSECSATVLNNSVVLVGQDPGDVKTAGFRELGQYLPQENETFINSVIVSVTTENQLASVEVRIKFALIKHRPRNVEIKCVAWDNNTRSWSSKGCEWDPSDKGLASCICRHLSSFAVLMSKAPMDIPGLRELTLVGLSVSVSSLILTLAIELAVWSSVVRTDQSFIRHTAHVNICLCLLVADSCFLAALNPIYQNEEMWCRIFVLLKHFSYLAVFFWMFSLSSMLLLNNVFVFHALSRKTYLRLSMVLGYACPSLIVVITFLYYNNGAEGDYYSSDTCWLRYAGLLKGSIHTFVVPVGAIALFNTFSMVVVIIKLLDNSATTNRYNEKEKKAAVSVVRSVILLTPIFGVTWIFGFAVMLVDLTSGPIAFVVHYAFDLLNTFQGFYILLTTCLADKQIREVLLNQIRRNEAASVTDSTTK